MKNEPIQNYILKSERNLTIAAAVGEAWPETRAKIVAEFIARLDTRLKKKLKGWESERWDGEFLLTDGPVIPFGSRPGSIEELEFNVADTGRS